jgi:hypothetical protein
MHALKHDNVVRFHSWYSTKGHVWVVVEYCAGGTLDSILKQDRMLPAPAVQVGATPAAPCLFLSSHHTRVATRPRMVCCRVVWAGCCLGVRDGAVPCGVG